MDDGQPSVGGTWTRQDQVWTLEPAASLDLLAKATEGWLSFRSGASRPIGCRRSHLVVAHRLVIGCRPADVVCAVGQEVRYVAGQCATQGHTPWRVSVKGPVHRLNAPDALGHVARMSRCQKPCGIEAVMEIQISNIAGYLVPSAQT